MVTPRDFPGELQERHLVIVVKGKEMGQGEGRRGKRRLKQRNSCSGKLQLVLQLDLFEAWERYSSLEQLFLLTPFLDFFQIGIGMFSRRAEHQQCILICTHPFEVLLWNGIYLTQGEGLLLLT